MTDDSDYATADRIMTRIERDGAIHRDSLAEEIAFARILGRQHAAAVPRTAVERAADSYAFALRMQHAAQQRKAAFEAVAHAFHQGECWL